MSFLESVGLGTVVLITFSIGFSSGFLVALYGAWSLNQRQIRQAQKAIRVAQNMAVREAEREASAIRESTPQPFVN